MILFSFAGEVGMDSAESKSMFDRYEIWGEEKNEFYTMIALFAFNKRSNELAKYNASS